MAKKSKRIILLGMVLLSIMLILSFTRFIETSGLSGSSDSQSKLKTSDDKILYLNRNYPFHLDDFYDDEDVTHIYTGTNFQKTYIPTGVQYNESVLNVNNSESQTPFNTGVSMAKGTFDNSDNMHSDDNSYSVFTSTEGVVVPNEYLYSITYTKGSGGPGTLADTQTDDENCKQIYPRFDGYYYEVDIKLNIENGYGGRDFYFSFHATSSGPTMELYKDTTLITSGKAIDFDDNLQAGINNYIRLKTQKCTGTFAVKIYYFLMIEYPGSTFGELNFTIQSPEFTNYERDDVLALKLTSNHFTTVSTATTTKIYNYDSGSWEQLWSATRLQNILKPIPLQAILMIILM